MEPFERSVELGKSGLGGSSDGRLVIPAFAMLDTEVAPTEVELVEGRVTLANREGMDDAKLLSEGEEDSQCALQTHRHEAALRKDNLAAQPLRLGQQTLFTRHRSTPEGIYQRRV